MAVTHERLRSLACYRATTGEFIRLSQSGPEVAGSIMGTEKRGRIVITIDGVNYFAHRLAWLYVTGAWPSGEIDHRDTDSLNNRWTNLRDVSSTVNKQNVRKAPAGKRYSPLLGAHWCAQRQTWKSSIRINGKVRHLGVFDTDLEASAAYIAAKRQHHPGNTL